MPALRHRAPGGLRLRRPGGAASPTPVTPPHSTFGSVAQGEQRPNSDVDLLHTLEGGRALGWEVEDLVESLTEVFHRPVDLVSRRSLHPMIRDRAMAEAETLYAAV